MAQLPSLADAPGTLREYETIYILRPDTLNDKVGDVNERVKGIIEERGGKILSVDNWGKRKLAYEVKKQLKGIYLYWQYLGTPEIVAEFERNMRMLDPVIRYMTVKRATDVVPDEVAAEVDADMYERAATTAADEEEILLGRAPASVGEDDDEGQTVIAASAEAAPAEAASAEAAPAEAAPAEAAPAEAAASESTTTDEGAETEAAPEKSEE